MVPGSIIFIIFITSILGGSMGGSGLGALMMIPFYLLTAVALFYYFYEVATSPWKNYLSNIIEDPKELSQYIVQIHEAPPGAVCFSVVCSHTETYTTQSTDSNGNTTTETHTKTVVTHSSTHTCTCERWEDDSDMTGMSLDRV